MNLIFFIWRTLLGLLPGWVTAVPAQAAAEAQPEIDRSVVRLRWRHAEVCCGWMQVAPVYVFGARPPSGQRGDFTVRACANRESLWNARALYRSTQRHGRRWPWAVIFS